MIETGSDAPDFTAPLAHGDGEIEPFTLSEHLDEAPIVLAFVPGVFTGTCTEELCTFDENLAAFEDVGATVYGVSVDTPFSLNRWREEEGISFGIVSDHAKEIIDAYDVSIDFEDYGYYGLADRAVFVVDHDGTITYAWVGENPGILPDFDEVEAAAAAAVASASA